MASATSSGPTTAGVTCSGSRSIEAHRPNGCVSFTRDGRLLTYVQNEVNGGHIWLLPFDGDRKPRPLMALPHDQGGGRASPDQRWVAYVSDEAGRWQVYVTPLAGGEKIQVSADGGEETVWATSGHELFYRNGTKTMIASVDAGDRLRVGKPRVLFDHPYARCCYGIPEYDVEPGDQTFIMIQDAEETSLPRINVVLNWVDELARVVAPSARSR